MGCGNPGSINISENENLPSASEQVQNKMELRTAQFLDLNHSGSVEAGDQVRLDFSRDIPAASFKSMLAMIHLKNAFDSFGRGAKVKMSSDKKSAFIILGEKPRLKVLGTYRPEGTTHDEPTLIQLADDTRSDIYATPILVNKNDRKVFAGEQYPVSFSDRAFFGQVHAHTSLSDGKLQPSDAFAMAKAHGLDFFFVTDHLEYLVLESDRWNSLRYQADRANEPGKFLAFAGYEWGGQPNGSSWYNHINILGSDRLMEFLQFSGLSGFYDHLGILPAGTVGIFNHPGHRKYLVFDINNWNHFAYNDHADLRMNLIRVQVTGAHAENIGYIPALDSGWHLSPEADEDNHGADWGSTLERTGVWAESLNRETIMEAFKRKATFYTDDPDASVKLIADSRWLMGSTVYGKSAHTLTVQLHHRNPGANSVSEIELVGFGGKVVAKSVGGAFPFRAEFTVDPAQDTYYYVRVREKSGRHLISAPIFIDR